MTLEEEEGSEILLLLFGTLELLDFLETELSEWLKHGRAEQLAERPKMTETELDGQIYISLYYKIMSLYQKKNYLRYS